MAAESPIEPREKAREAGRSVYKVALDVVLTGIVVILESGIDNFRSVKLVEFPFDDVYVLGLETSRAGAPVMVVAGNREMVTLFLPLAPNPVMGGFLAHIPEERVMDVDMTVEEAVRTIITSGIAVEEPESGEFRELTDEEREGIGDPTTGSLSSGADAGQREGNRDRDQDMDAGAGAGGE